VGGLRSVVLGFESFDPYPAHSPHLGSLAGRVANRIGDARFTLDGTTYQLIANEGTTQLHGGPEGIGRQVWQMEPDSAANAVRFALDSPDGAMGYPGNVHMEALYTLTGNRLRLELSATTDRPTPISLVQHQYFNLGLTHSVLDHTVQMPHCVARTESDDRRVMTGVISPIADTIHDFRKPRTLRDPTGAPIDYDLNLVLATRRDFADPIAITTGEDGALTLKLRSDRPGLQFYNAMMTDIAVPGLGGKPYKKYSGICFEDQAFPDAVNQPHFPDVICTPDKPYAHWCEFEIA
jgi:aldose 1-epimerase